MRENTRHLFFWTWVTTSLCIILFKFHPFICKLCYFACSYTWVICHWVVCTTFFWNWTFTLVPLPSCCEQSSSEHEEACISGAGIKPSGVHAQKWCSWVIWQKTYTLIFKMAALVYIPSQSCKGVGPHPAPPHPHWHWLSLVFLMMAILTGVRRWELNVVLIFISKCLKMLNAFKCHLDIYISSCENPLFSSLAHFLNWVAYILNV